MLWISPCPLRFLSTQLMSTLFVDILSFSVACWCILLSWTFFLGSRYYPLYPYWKCNPTSGSSRIASAHSVAYSSHHSSVSSGGVPILGSPKLDECSTFSCSLFLFFTISRLPANLNTKPAHFLSLDRVQVLDDCILVTKPFSLVSVSWWFLSYVWILRFVLWPPTAMSQPAKFMDTSRLILARTGVTRVSFRQRRCFLGFQYNGVSDEIIHVMGDWKVTPTKISGSSPCRPRCFSHSGWLPPFICSLHDQFLLSYRFLCRWC